MLRVAHGARRWGGSWQNATARWGRVAGQPRQLSAIASSSSVLEQLGIDPKAEVSAVFDGSSWAAEGPVHKARNPSTGETLATVRWGSEADMDRCVSAAVAAQEEWQLLPGPKRGDVVRQIGDKLREKKDLLGALLSLEMGKIHAEGNGEVQEYIDVCDLAAGMSRQLPGQILPSERTEHSLMEAWNPLGTVGIITAFNFPHAVTGWNSAISMICGNTQILKGAESASLMTIATQKVITEVLVENGINPAVATLCVGEGTTVGEKMLQDERVDLVSFTGSTNVGRHVQRVVGDRFGQSILELGGNNAIVVMPSADLEMALRSVLFAAVGTCGQRCTSLRRLLVHEDVYDELVEKLVSSYGNLPYGHPLDPKTLVGPIHNEAGLQLFERTVEEATSQGGKLRVGGDKVPKDLLPSEDLSGGCFVRPAIVEIDSSKPIVQEERFVPVLYVSKVKDLDEAIALNNSVKQGLSSALFSNDMRDVFKWALGPRGSDCGIVNVNTSCSGAEIGGAFGGNKSTGNGRECGSDAWKQYMRRSTICINYGTSLPLAQGIDFSS
eukprot:CAMPEP_0184522912 /NCGR_PEP_ID=MMETSP0198_2-20121128/8565_1 /TAXON_ID=1112570 /ORGANISM="Thraustochytrium sp., Strain LLF1b" /LENGTH=553 /DNA_ID=CAMNT_0026913831 /DNA_START=241 /DNA_END=1902 /DNA_ORIENTATION=-